MPFPHSNIVTLLVRYCKVSNVNERNVNTNTEGGDAATKKKTKKKPINTAS